MNEKVYNHKKFGDLSKFELDNYLDLLFTVLQSINDLELYHIENDPTPHEFKEKSKFIFNQIIEEKNKVEDILLSKKVKTKENLIGYIVEGTNDKNRILLVNPNAHFVVLEGTNFHKKEKQKINDLMQVCDKVFILTDPDETGDMLAKKIKDVYPMLERINVDAKEAKCFYNKRKVKIGVEHCSLEYLSKLLK